MLVHKPGYYAFVEDIVEDVSDSARSDNIRAYKAASELAHCSRILEPIDETASGKLFTDALQASKAIDEDGPFLADAIAQCARQFTGAGTKEERQDLALKVLDAFEGIRPRIDEEQEMPWMECLRTVTALAPEVGVQLLFALDHHGWYAINDGVWDLMDGLAESNQVDGVAAACLHELGDLTQSRLDGLLRQISEGADNQRQVSLIHLGGSLSRAVLSESAYNARENMCRSLADWAERKKLAASWQEGVRKAQTFYALKQNWQDTGHGRVNSQSQKKPWWENEVAKITRRRSFGSVEKTVHHYLAAMRDHSREAGLVLDAVAGRLRGRERVEYLRALASYKHEGWEFTSQDVAKLMAKALQSWRQHRTVIVWAKEEFPGYLEQHFPELIAYDTNYSSFTRDIMECEIIPSNERGAVLLPTICKYASRLSARRICELAGSYVLTVNPETAHGAFEEVTKKFTTGELARECGKSIPSNKSNTWTIIQEVIYGAFCHPDNRIKWRGLHALRLLHSINPVECIQLCLTMLDTKDAFMWMSAREWVLFFFLHLSHVDPNQVARYAGNFLSIATDESFPHAGMQELAKRIALRVHHHDPTAFDIKTVQILNRVNEPSASLLEREGQSQGRQSEKWRFPFDDLDTMPYWFSPLARCFGLHRCDVARYAEKWICDEWNMTGESCYEHDRKWIDRSDWGLTSHRQGSRPVIEVLERYVERHGMMMAAGEMIRQQLPVADDKDGNPTRWHKWVSRKCFEGDPSITSDARTGLPLDSFFHGVFPDVYKTDASLPCSETRKHVLWKDGKDTWITVGADYSVKTYNLSVSCSLSSALVTPKMARSLAVTIAAMENPHVIKFPDYSIPDEVENLKCLGERLAHETEHDHGGTIRKTPFVFIPWIVSCSSSDGLHVMDPHWPSSVRRWEGLSADTLADMGLTPGPYHITFVDESSKVHAFCNVWNDELLHGSQARYSYGHRLNIRRENLLGFLRKRKMDLICRLIVRRESENRKKQEDYDYGQATIFIVRQSGRIEQMETRD